MISELKEFKSDTDFYINRFFKERNGINILINVN